MGQRSKKKLNDDDVANILKEIAECEIVQFRGGHIHFVKEGTVVASGYAPGRVGCRDLRGRKCIECDHWARRQTDPGYFLREDCPCFECAGYGLSTRGILPSWKGTPKCRRFRVTEGRIR